MEVNWKLFKRFLAYGETMGEFSRSDFDLGGNYISTCIDKHSRGLFIFLNVYF